MCFDRPLRADKVVVSAHPRIIRCVRETILAGDENTRRRRQACRIQHADDNFVRSERHFEAHYFHTSGKAELTVPAGHIDVEVMKGFEYRFEKRSVQAFAGKQTSLTIRLEPLNLPLGRESRWISGDVHVHMNYGGAYRNTPQNLVAQAAAENLPVVESLIVNKEQRIPDISYFSTKPDPASTANNLLMFGQEFHTSYWGHLGLLNLTRNFLIPDYVGYPNTAAASLFPANATVAAVAEVMMRTRYPRSGREPAAGRSGYSLRSAWASRSARSSSAWAASPSAA